MKSNIYSSHVLTNKMKIYTINSVPKGYSIVNRWDKMNITQESDYAIRAVLIMAKNPEQEVLAANTISEIGSIPIRFLLKFLRKLSQSGIIKSYRGVNGGYSLEKNPREINLRMIIEAIEGPIWINRCLYDPKTCSAGKGDNCAIHMALYNVQLKIINELESINFEDLKDGAW